MSEAIFAKLDQNRTRLTGSGKLRLPLSSTSSQKILLKLLQKIFFFLRCRNRRRAWFSFFVFLFFHSESVNIDVWWCFSIDHWYRRRCYCFCRRTLPSILIEMRLRRRNKKNGGKRKKLVFLDRCFFCPKTNLETRIETKIPVFVFFKTNSFFCFCLLFAAAVWTHERAEQHCW